MAYFLSVQDIKGTTNHSAGVLHKKSVRVQNETCLPTLLLLKVFPVLRPL